MRPMAITPPRFITSLRLIRSLMVYSLSSIGPIRPERKLLRKVPVQLERNNEELAGMFSAW
jgi:hypothetical protein